MLKRALPAAIALLSLSLPSAAQDSEEARLSGTKDTGPTLALYEPDVFRAVDGSVLLQGLPALTLLDGRRLPVSTALGRMGMTSFDLFPLALLRAAEVHRANALPIYGPDAPDGVENLRSNRFYSGGEMGFSYGKSTGKFGGELWSAYILGTVGNEKFNITAGAYYEESEWRLPRRVR